MPDQIPPSGSNPAGTVALYSVGGVVIGTVLGSLAAAVVLLYLNYRALGYESLARKVAGWGTGIYLILIALTSQLPPSMTVNLLVIGIQAVVAYFAASTLQGAAISYHQEHGGYVHSLWRAAAVGLLTGLALIMMLVMTAVFIGSLSGGS